MKCCPAAHSTACRPTFPSAPPAAAAPHGPGTLSTGCRPRRAARRRRAPRAPRPRRAAPQPSSWPMPRHSAAGRPAGGAGPEKQQGGCLPHPSDALCGPQQNGPPLHSLKHPSVPGTVAEREGLCSFLGAPGSQRRQAGPCSPATFFCVAFFRICGCAPGPVAETKVVMSWPPPCGAGPARKARGGGGGGSPGQQLPRPPAAPPWSLLVRK